MVETMKEKKWFGGNAFIRELHPRMDDLERGCDSF